MSVISSYSQQSLTKMLERASVMARNLNGGNNGTGKNGTGKNGTGITTYAEKMAPLENCKIKKRKKQQFFLRI